MTKLTIIGTSLNPNSKSQQLAQLFQQQVETSSIACQRFDLRELNIPFSGPDENWATPDLEPIKQAVEQSSHIIFSVPIYCYDVNAAAKNIIELMGRSFTNKVIGFICSAGGSSSYMSVMGFANHLMLAFRSVICPRFLYVTPQDWDEQGELDTDIKERMSLLLEDLKSIQIN